MPPRYSDQASLEFVSVTWLAMRDPVNPRGVQVWQGGPCEPPAVGATVTRAWAADCLRHILWIEQRYRVVGMLEVRYSRPKRRLGIA
jgi:hypothetical protein